jgi:hypothetical protein
VQRIPERRAGTTRDESARHSRLARSAARTARRARKNVALISARLAAAVVSTTRDSSFLRRGDATTQYRARRAEGVAGMFCGW